MTPTTPRTKRIMIEPSPRKAVQNLNTFQAIAAPDLCILKKHNLLFLLSLFFCFLKVKATIYNLITELETQHVHFQGNWKTEHKFLKKKINFFNVVYFTCFCLILGNSFGLLGVWIWGFMGLLGGFGIHDCCKFKEREREREREIITFLKKKLKKLICEIRWWIRFGFGLFYIFF